MAKSCFWILIRAKESYNFDVPLSTNVDNIFILVFLFEINNTVAKSGKMAVDLASLCQYNDAFDILAYVEHCSLLPLAIVFVINSKSTIASFQNMPLP